jgi:EmrB/QacA subfamily drug resistance transporter
VVIAGIMLSLFLAAVESTVVATAMPTIVAELGGLATYSWVFSAYMLTSTTTIPLYGKLSDLYGRRRLYFISMTLFLVGSVLSGLSQTMGQLIAFRALQGLGAGGVMPLAFIMIGDMLNLERRARMQGLFSGVWGVASVVGPLVGGFLVDQLSWHWVFFVNLIPGLLAILLVGIAWRDVRRPDSQARPVIDYAGVALLSLGVVAFLLALLELGSSLSWALILLSVAFLFALYHVERRAVDPVLPLRLFPDRLFSVATVQGLLAGWAMFGSTNFVPLFGQAVLGLSATAAGSLLAPQMLSWVVASIIGSRLLLRVGYRTVAVAGMVLLTAGSLLMTRIAVIPSMVLVAVSLGIMGAGMGMAMPAFLIAVQNEVRRDMLGAATATLQFSRNIGGMLGVSVMGAILATQASANLFARGIDPESVSLSALIGGADLGTLGARGTAVEGALAGAMASVFVAALVAAVLALLVTLLAPRERIGQRTQPAHGHGEPVLAEAEAIEP